MGIASAISEMLSRLKPGTSQAIIVILAAAIGGMSTTFAQAWWITIHGTSYQAAEVKRYSDLADDMVEVKRRLKAIEESRDTERNERAADRILVWGLKGDMRELNGKMDIVLRRTR